MTQNGYEKKYTGTPGSIDFKLYLTRNGELVDILNDIPYRNEDGTYTMVVEIPRNTNTKYELNMKTPFHPIASDVKDGAIRQLANVFPFKGTLFNYGALTQTYENPELPVSFGANFYKGDGDPIDVCEIGTRRRETGDVVKVHILGALAMIDSGECDWKVFAVGTDDPLYETIKNDQDLLKLCPRLVEDYIYWCERYKLPEKKPKNFFEMNNKLYSREETEKIIEETHDQWKTISEKKIQTEKLEMKEVTREVSSALNANDRTEIVYISN